MHYCVANMPGIYPRTSTLAITGATLPYVLELAAEGLGAFRNASSAAGVEYLQGENNEPGRGAGFRPALG